MKHFRFQIVIACLWALFGIMPCAAQIGVNYGQNPTVGAGQSPNGRNIHAKI